MENLNTSYSLNLCAESNIRNKRNIEILHQKKHPVLQKITTLGTNLDVSDGTSHKRDGKWSEILYQMMTEKQTPRARFPPPLAPATNIYRLFPGFFCIGFSSSLAVFSIICCILFFRGDVREKDWAVVGDSLPNDE